MFTAKLITTSVIVSFAIIGIMNFLAGREKSIKLFQLAVIISILASLYNLLAGIYLLSGWEDPLASASSEEIGKASARSGGKGGIVILLIKYWPYALIAWGGYTLYHIRSWYSAAFNKD